MFFDESFLMKGHKCAQKPVWNINKVVAADGFYFVIRGSISET
jgi:hypothetical protein